MAVLKRLLLATVALAALLANAGPATAQLAGHPVELSVQGGIFSADARARIQDGPAFGGSIGWRWSPMVTLEGQGLYATSTWDVPGAEDHKFLYAGADVRWNLRDPSGRVVPYILTGIGYGRSDKGVPGGTSFERGAPSLGAGALFNLFGNQNSYLRFQVRDVMFREQAALTTSNHLFATVGLHWLFGGKAKDQDLDKVRNWLDQCPDTPIGAKVDARGCPVDSDADSVYDGIDQCEGTPRGCKVDKNGCILDADGDGVCDGLDQCADTPKGAKVDARGCPLDTDGDHVFDGLDKCENTAKGCAVDSSGCPVDADGDSVCDGVDQCPNTPAGLRVDPNGCPIEVSEKETQLLDTGVIRIRNINFDVNKAVIKPESYAVIDTVGQILIQYPQLKIEIGGHTDSSGKKDLNQKLSEARARSVLNYLTTKHPTIDAEQFTAVGYGQEQPVATNKTALGKAMNRRVEFKVTNTDALKIEREKRRFLMKGEAAPADSTKR